MTTHTLTGKILDFGDAPAKVTGTITAGGMVDGAWVALPSYATVDGVHVASVEVAVDSSGNLTRKGGGPVVLEESLGFGYRLTLRGSGKTVVFHFVLTADLDLKDVPLASPTIPALSVSASVVRTVNGVAPDIAGDVTVAGGGGGGGASTAYVDGAVSAEASARAAADGALSTALSGKVDSTDPRLSDARTPTTHEHTSGDLTDATTVGKAVLTAATAAAARTAIGAGTSSFDGTYAALTGKPTLGDAAAKNTGTTAGTLAAGDDTRITGAAQKAANLSDLASPATARTNLGLGNAATKDTGAAAGTVAAGDDSRILAGSVGRIAGVSTVATTSYAPALADEGKLVLLNHASPITVTLPADATLNFPVGAVLNFQAIGAGMATFTKEAAASLTATPSAVTRATSSVVSAIKIGANAWTLTGDLA